MSNRLRLMNLAKWQHIADGKALSFAASSKPRTVVLEVNTAAEVILWIVQEPEDLAANPARVDDIEAQRATPEIAGNPQEFPVLVHGRCTVEFGVSGAFKIVADGGEAWVHTAEGMYIAAVVEAPVSFTKLANRRQRNPHLEMIEWKLKENQRLFQEQIRAEFDRRVAAIAEGTENTRYVSERDTREVAAAASEALSAGQEQHAGEGASEAAPSKAKGSTGGSAKSAEPAAAAPADSGSKAGTST